MDYVTTQQFDDFLVDEKQHHEKDEEYMRSVGVQVAAVGQQVAGLGVQLITSQKQIEQHHRTLYGNGEIGMDEQIREIFKWIKKQDEKEAEITKERKERNTFYTRFVITTVVANLLVLMTSAFLWLFKIMPVLDALSHP